MKNRKTKKVVRILLLTVGLPLYCLLVSELFLRIFAPVPILPRYICATDYGIRGNESNCEYWHVTPEYKIEITTNSKGIRSEKEYLYQKPEGTKRVVVLGDSFGMGYGVSLEDTFTCQMKDFLQDHGYTVEVINLSVSGHGNAEQLIMLENEGFRYEPDLVLLQWHSTDTLDNVRSGLFRLKEGELERQDSVYLPGVKIRERLFKNPFYRFMAERSHFYNYFREWAAAKIKKMLASFRSTKSNSNQDKQNDAGAYSQKLTLTLLNTIQQRCDQNDASLLLLDIPRIRKRTYFWSVFPRREEMSFIGHYYSPIEDFEQYSEQKLYWEKSHGHLTPLGCKIVGQGLGQYIIDQDLLN